MENVLSIEEVCKGRLFCIPDYQRGYTWEKQQCEELLEDIELLPEKKEHYTGTLVLHKVKHTNGEIIDEDGTRHTTHEIVDGQQRLTTLIILLDVIRREAEKIHSLTKLADGIKRKFICINDEHGSPHPRLTLNRDCKDFFEQGIISDHSGTAGPSIASHQRLLAAKAFFTKQLDEKKTLNGAFDEYLRNLHNKITHQLKVTFYEVGDAADVGVIFEVMNNRGKQLTELEKVKNYLLYLASKLNIPNNKLGEKINGVWTTIFEGLMSTGSNSGADENQFLRAHWLMKYNPDRRHWDGSKSIKKLMHLKEYIGQSKQLSADISAYTQTLQDASVAYCDILNPHRTGAFTLFEDHKARREVIALSMKLRRVKVIAPFLPLLFAVRLKYPTDAQKYLEVLSLCEKFAFRVYRFLQKRTHAGQSRLFALGHQLYNEQISYEGTIQSLVWLINYYSPDKDWRDEFTPLGENWYDWVGLKYFLYEYEEYLAGGKEVKLPWDVVDQKSLQETIEHILPQTPKNDYWKQRFDRDARKKFINDIGNLTLTYDNSNLGNKPFPDKVGSVKSNKRCYSNSPLFIEKELAKHREWTPTAVIKRRKKLIAWALERWAVEMLDTDEIGYDVDEADDAEE
ncbi:MAG: DUF262 domain-containing protein [Desulfobacteraceae bacterium]|nr:MAG: DUF262 domain-containing protein [Desulfobacteraceae bacterium]